MTDRYVGPGGADGNDGLSWANRKLTLNGVEDTPVVAGDTVYVGPGVYRENLTCDVAGTSGSIITYIGDVTGENTDTIGGEVRLTGSDNDTTGTRANGIDDGSGIDFRTFRGFSIDMTTQNAFRGDSDSTDWIIEDCVIHDNFLGGIHASHTNARRWITRRCVFYSNGGINVNYDINVAADDTGFDISNCLVLGSGGGNDSLRLDFTGDATVRNCTIDGSMDDGVDVGGAVNAGHQVLINNCIITHCDSAGIEGTATGDILEDYNTFWENTADRSAVDTGANSQTYPPLFTPPILKDGFVMPWIFGQLSEHSSVGRLAGTSEETDDLYGIVRPTTSAKISWGAVQLREAERETGTVQTGSAALTLADAGDHQVYVYTTATSTTFKVAARYESEYAGTLPQLIVRQPGQADSVDTMVAAADTWEDLSITLTPDANPPYVIMIFRSLNTSVTGDFDTYWDDLDVS